MNIYDHIWPYVPIYPSFSFRHIRFSGLQLESCFWCPFFSILPSISKLPALSPTFNPFNKNKIKPSFKNKIFFLKPSKSSSQFSPVEFQNYLIKLAETRSELKQAQSLRYSVFYKEKKAKPNLSKKLIRLDYDKIDKFADHLIVIDKKKSSKNKIVGTYRLIRGDVANLFGGFYSSTEFNLVNIINNKNLRLKTKWSIKVRSFTGFVYGSCLIKYLSISI